MAITLGPNTRSAVLGQPLDISVQMLLEAGDDPQALCLDASVFYADRQLDPSKVQVAAEKAASAQESLIRIRAAAPVEGPVVTVHLRAGCVQKTSRRYVVLAMAKPRSASDADNVVTVASVPGVPATGVPAANAADSPQSADKIQALETELRQVRDELLKNQAALAESKSQLNIAQSERSKGLVYGVAGIVAFAFAGLSLLLLQRSGGEQAMGSRLPWWRRPKQANLGAYPEPSAVAPVSEAGRLDMDESLFDDLKRHSQRAPLDSIPPLPRRDRARFSVSVPFVPRTVKVPELFDLQQQVDFFTSLGQLEKAIDLLREHLVNNVKTSALVYLDLLDLYHQAGKEEDYEILRADFNRVFSTDIAPYDSYSAEDAGTQAYEAVQARIQAAWPTRRVFEIIEDALFREPGNPAEVMGLEAYRELLLLYAVAREINELESGVSGRMADTHWPDLAMQPRSSPRLGLDIDLSQFSGRAEEGASSLQRGDRSHVGKRRTVSDRQAAAPRGDFPANAGSGRVPLTPLEPTVLDSLVDFDDYDTGFRPDDFGKPTRS